MGPIPTFPTGTHLIVADQAPAGVSGPAARWYRGYAQVADVPRWGAFCPTVGRPPDPPYLWTTGCILMWTNVGATFGAWTPSPSANRLEGTVTGVSGGPVYRLTWRLERVIE